MTPKFVRWLGLGIAPIAWALSTQLGQTIPYIDCRDRLAWTATVCALLIAVSAGGLLAATMTGGSAAKSRRFTFGVSHLVSAIILFAPLLQGAAAVLLDPCQF